MSTLVLGASGLVGTALTRLLLDDITYDIIPILVRKPTNWMHDKLVEHVIDFDRLALFSTLFEVDTVFCCLGTTIKEAKTKAAFYHADHDYVLEAGKLTAKYQANFLVVSSMGSDLNAMFFYSRVKGKMEQSLQKLSIPSLHIFRHSLLLGDRSEFRFGEKIATPLSRWFLRGPLKRFKPNHALTVAKVMVYVSKKSSIGCHIYDSNLIEKTAKELT